MFFEGHRHLREGEMLKFVTSEDLPLFSRIVVMPNTKVPITGAIQMIEYRRKITDEIGTTGWPELLLTVQITPKTTAQDVAEAHLSGAFAGKAYPFGVTNSEFGIADFTAPGFVDVLATMQELGMPFLSHCEAPGADVFNSERRFIPTLQQIIESFPKLPVVFEHVSTREGLEFVRRASRGGHPVFGTLTLHHAILCRDDVFSTCVPEPELRNPHYFCKPVANSPEDRDAILEAMLSAEPYFGLGSDSAPHLGKYKEGPKPPPGIYVPPRLLCGKLAELFQAAGGDWSARLAAFACRNAEEFHGFAPTNGRLKIIRRPWQVSTETERLPVVPFLAGEIVEWDVDGMMFER